MLLSRLKGYSPANEDSAPATHGVLNSQSETQAQSKHDLSSWYQYALQICFLLLSHVDAAKCDGSRLQRSNGLSSKGRSMAHREKLAPAFPNIVMIALSLLAEARALALAVDPCQTTSHVTTTKDSQANQDCLATIAHLDNCFWSIYSKQLASQALCRDGLLLAHVLGNRTVLPLAGPNSPCPYYCLTSPADTSVSATYGQSCVCM